MDVQDVISGELRKIFDEQSVEWKPLEDDTVLLETGLDSLAFAVLVTRLELALGYDPFMLMEEPVYPRTWGTFVEIYERYKDHATGS